MSTGIEAIAAIGKTETISTIVDPNVLNGRGAASTPELGFGDMLANGLKSVEQKIDIANAKVRDFSVDENVPIHEVTIALEEARLSVELALQVRTRLVEGYREIMNMQL
ncbi:flagellar hook-basal body complex protein FliE [Fretibacter rubidus]|uniref:flagellar hook-basal body complex protein FliE n=1 Tax=Fretibacter rubidus TaxID=570162 RepID=UPI003529F18E